MIVGLPMVVRDDLRGCASSCAAVRLDGEYIARSLVLAIHVATACKTRVKTCGLELLQLGATISYAEGSSPADSFASATIVFRY